MENFQNCILNTQWLTERQVHEHTRLSLSTLRSHRFYGKGIPYSKIGRSVRYSMADVQCYMEQHKIKTKG